MTHADYCVASFTDAWIETYSGSDNESDNKSHLLQMRGLKLLNRRNIHKYKKSHLLQMRGLKQKVNHQINIKYKSHLLQMRGLKLEHYIFSLE